MSTEQISLLAMDMANKRFEEEIESKLPPHYIYDNDLEEGFVCWRLKPKYEELINLWKKEFQLQLIINADA